jgi:hypothetical protein
MRAISKLFSLKNLAVGAAASASLQVQRPADKGNRPALRTIVETRRPSVKWPVWRKEERGYGVFLWLVAQVRVRFSNTSIGTLLTLLTPAGNGLDHRF